MSQCYHMVTNLAISDRCSRSPVHRCIDLSHMILIQVSQIAFRCDLTDSKLQLDLKLMTFDFTWTSPFWLQRCNVLPNSISKAWDFWVAPVAHWETEQASHNIDHRKFTRKTCLSALMLTNKGWHIYKILNILKKALKIEPYLLEKDI